MSGHKRNFVITPGDGLLAGAIAGLVMSIFMMLWDGLAGDGIWTLPQAIATILLGPDVYEGGQAFLPVPVVTALALHELASAAMGLSFCRGCRVFHNLPWPMPLFTVCCPVLSPTGG